MAMKSMISTISLSLVAPLKPKRPLTLTAPPSQLSFPTRTHLHPTFHLSSSSRASSLVAFARTNPWNNYRKLDELAELGGDDDDVVLDSLGRYLLLETDDMEVVLESTLKTTAVFMLSEEDVVKLMDICDCYKEMIQAIQGFSEEIQKKSPRRRN